METGPILWLAVVIYLFSIVANGIMNRQGEDASPGFFQFCFVLFMMTNGFGYKLHGWWGVAGAVVAQILGMLIVIMMLSLRRSHR